MSRRLLSYLLCIAATLLCVASCKKKPKDNTTTTPKNTYASQIKGSWLLAGPGCLENGSDYSCSGVFSYFSFTALNDTEIVCSLSDTLKYVSTNTDSQIVTFVGNAVFYKSVYSETLIYHYSTNTINYSYNYNGASSGQYFAGSGNLQPINWPGASTIKKYTDNIIGTKLLSGTLFDSIYMPYTKDSTVLISDSVTFTLINDSVLKYNKDYARVGNDELYFKTLNEQTQTIVFETLHSPLDPKATLTYNYATNKITLEQAYSLWYFKGYIRLE